MANLKENAQQYEETKTLNIADLDLVSVDNDLKEETFTDKEGKPFTISYIEVEGQKYRVPKSVIRDLKAILEKMPNLESFSVTKSGTGLDTNYTVIPRN